MYNRIDTCVSALGLKICTGSFVDMCSFLFKIMTIFMGNLNIVIGIVGNCVVIPGRN